MQPFSSQAGEKTQPEACSGSKDCSNILEGQRRTQKRKLEVVTDSQGFGDTSKKCRIEDLILMEGSSGSSQNSTPNNGIIKPINNQMNHFHQAGKSSGTIGYGAKPSQAKKLVIKNFKGQIDNVIILSYFRT